MKEYVRTIILPSLQTSFVLFFFGLLVSCGSKQKIDPRFDDSLYEEIATDGTNKFFKGNDGKLYIKTITVDTSAEKKDKLLYYYRNIPDINLESYQRLHQKGYYALDNQRVYKWDTDEQGENCEVIEGADPKSFETLAYLWGKDNNHIYYQGEVIEGFEPNTFKLVCYEEIDSTLTYADLVSSGTHLYISGRRIIPPKDMVLEKVECTFDLMGNLHVIYQGKQFNIEGDSLVKD